MILVFFVMILHVLNVDIIMGPYPFGTIDFLFSIYCIPRRWGKIQLPHFKLIIKF